MTTRPRTIADLDDYRAEVIAERDAQIIAWLTKKSREYGDSNSEDRAKAEAVGRMASKLSRGAVRENNTQMLPRTERSYWVDIADALNAAEKAGMPVGIDLDGTLTDHTTWSVIWDRKAEQWAVAGYDTEETEEPQEQATTPLLVSRFDTATEPAPEEDQVLIVGCIDEHGRPVALFFDPETRTKVANWLRPT